MDRLHTTLRSIESETKSENKNGRRDHLDVFREFIAQMDRAAHTKRKATAVRAPQPSKSKGARRR